MFAIAVKRYNREAKIQQIWTISDKLIKKCSLSLIFINSILVKSTFLLNIFEI